MTNLFLRTALVCVCSILVLGVQADEYQGRIVKVEKDTLTLAVTWRGDAKKGVQVNPEVKTEFPLDAKLKVLNFRAEEVKDDATRQRILRKGEYVIVNTEKKNNKEAATSIQTLPGAGPGGS